MAWFNPFIVSIASFQSLKEYLFQYFWLSCRHVKPDQHKIIKNAFENNFSRCSKFFSAKATFWVSLNNDKVCIDSYFKKLSIW